jgi:hypothetical protein
MHRPSRFADPTRFALGIGVPCDIESWGSRRDGRSRDLAGAVALETASRDIETMCRQANLAARSGVHVVRNLSASSLPRLFDGKDVVTVIAHFNFIPGNFDGCLELLLCFSEKLADSIRFRKGCLVLGHAQTTELRYALSIYLMALLSVLERGWPYPEALFCHLNRLLRKASP